MPGLEVEPKQVERIVGARVDWLSWDVNALGLPVNSGEGDDAIFSPKGTLAFKGTDDVTFTKLAAGTKLADVVKALNGLGATPQDLLAILQAMKAAGALNAELEVI